MKEIKRMLAIYEQIDLSVRRAALATVVYVKGRLTGGRPGARMLVTDDGRGEGTISGGCLESDTSGRGFSESALSRSRLVSTW